MRHGGLVLRGDNWLTDDEFLPAARARQRLQLSKRSTPVTHKYLSSPWISWTIL